MRSSPARVVKEEDEELAALGGKTRLVARKSPSLPSSPEDSLQSHSTPSPKGSPTQHYPAEHPQMISDHPSHNAVGQSGSWPLYAQPLDNGYGAYYTTSAPGQWSPQTEYPQSQGNSPSTMITPAPSYNPYEQFPPMGHSFISSQSNVEAPTQADVHASWQSLYAQYQPGMLG